MVTLIEAGPPTDAPTQRPIDTSVPPKPRALMAVSVDGVEIAETDILAEAQNHPSKDPGGAVRAATRALVVRELLAAEARRQGIEPRPERDAKGRLEDDTDALVRRLIDRDIEVPAATKAECERYFDAHPQRFCTPPIYAARHILLSVPGGNPAKRRETERQAKGLIALLHENPDQFAGYAKRHSACSSRDDGGRLGQIEPGQTVAEFDHALAAMSPGELRASPVETRFGFHVVRLDEREDGRRLPFAQVESRIAAWLEASSWARAVAQYVGMIAARSRIEGFDLDTGEIQPG